VIDRNTDTLLGATFVGSDVAELLHSATTAIVGNIPLETLWHVVPSYPTVSEVWLRLLESRRRPGPRLRGEREVVPAEDDRPVTPAALGRVQRAIDAFEHDLHRERLAGGDDPGADPNRRQ